LRNIGVTVMFDREPCRDPSRIISNRGPSVLLADIRDVFTEAGADRMESRVLVTALAAKDDRPWAEWRNGKSITVNQIATILEPFGIHPKTIRFRDRTAKGYLFADLEDAFARYAPDDA
jgi:hypothetical protein